MLQIIEAVSPPVKWAEFADPQEAIEHSKAVNREI